MSLLKTTLAAASVALIAVSSASAATRHTVNADARAAYAAQFSGERHPGNIGSDTSREGLVQTNQ
jgi:hypothetical protein